MLVIVHNFKQRIVTTSKSKYKSVLFISTTMNLISQITGV